MNRVAFFPTSLKVFQSHLKTHLFSCSYGVDSFVCDSYQLAAKESGTSAPTFRSMSIVAKRSPISATAELLWALFQQQR